MAICKTLTLRAFAVPDGGGEYFNGLVNAFNRLPRPFITAWLVGGFAESWLLPEPDAIGPRWWTVFIIVLKLQYNSPWSLLLTFPELPVSAVEFCAPGAVYAPANLTSVYTGWVRLDRADSIVTFVTAHNGRSQAIMNLT